tara:strand:+ start:2410 stop:2676 length:267 start_codon:yes stop_codon:yes gene_type:complete
MPWAPDTERIANLAIELQDAIGYNFPWEISHSDKLCLDHTTIEQIIQAVTDLKTLEQILRKDIRTKSLGHTIQRIKQAITKQTNKQGR